MKSIAVFTDLSDDVELFHTAEGIAFADLMIGDHWLADLQQPLSDLAEVSTLQGRGLSSERRRDRVGPRSA